MCLAKCRSIKKKVLVGGTRPAAPAVELNEVTAQLHPQIWERRTIVRQALSTCALQVPESSSSQSGGTWLPDTPCAPHPIIPGALHTAANRSDTSPPQKQQGEQVTVNTHCSPSFFPSLLGCSNKDKDISMEGLGCHSWAVDQGCKEGR